MKDEKEFDEFMQHFNAYSVKYFKNNRGESKAKRSRLFTVKFSLHTLKEFVELSPDSCVEVLMEDDDLLDNVQDFILAVALKEHEKDEDD